MSTTRKTTATPSTLLAQAAAKAKLTAQEFNSVKAWLADQMLANQYAKLDQGGYLESEIALRSVFVDLPSADQPVDNTRGDKRVLFLQNFMAAGPVKLHSQGAKVVQAEAPQIALFEDEHLTAGRQARLSTTLLIGGPGQGKSTLSQLACQLHRAALLQPYAPDLSARHREMIQSFSQTGSSKAAKSGKGAEKPPKSDIGIPPDPLLPLQIALPELAAWQAKHDNAAPNKVPALLRYLASTRSAASCSLQAAHLLALCAQMPCLLVLDGFDEVGALDDRARLVSAAKELLAALAKFGTPIQILATTRPQGYAGELANIGVALQERFLLPLAEDEALDYAALLVQAKVPDKDKQASTLERLHEAAKEDATQKLMTTPLQVTILASIAQHEGRMPRERWNLFLLYFNHTYRREIERNTYASPLLQNYRLQIERIHARVGLLLQVESEGEGGAGARMPRARLEEVIHAVLEEDDIATDDRQAVVKDIAHAAEQRLVFLVEPEPGCFGFEIRSLQEFMAAWALTTGRESEVQARLLTVAKAAMFRNVTLFIASRLFSEGSALRDLFVDHVCMALEQNDELASHTRAGAVLALEILEEGAATAQPKRARALMQQALRLLDLPPDFIHLRLASFADTALGPDLLLALDLATSTPGPQYRAAWLCLYAAANQNDNAYDNPARTLLVKNLPKLIDAKAFMHDRRLYSRLLPAWFCEQFDQFAAQFSPAYFWFHRQLPPEGPNTTNDWASWLIAVFSPFRFRGNMRHLDLQEIPLTTVARPTNRPAPSEWQAWITIADFANAPSAATLAAALDSFAAQTLFEQRLTFKECLPWPLQAAVRSTTTASDLRQYAQIARQGLLGDTADWLAAEAKWKTLKPASLLTALLNAPQQVLWSKDTIRQCPPLLALSSSAVGITTMKTNWHQRPAQLATIMEDAAPQSIKAWWLNAYFKCATANRLALPQDNLRPQNWATQIPVDAILLTTFMSDLQQEQWHAALDLATISSNQWFGIDNTTVIESFCKSGGHPTLFALLTQVGFYRFSQEFKSKAFASTLARYAQALATTPNGRVGLGLLNLALEQPDTALLDLLPGHIVAIAPTNPDVWQAFWEIFDNRFLPQARKEALLLDVLPQLSADYVARAVDMMRDWYSQRQSPLKQHATWANLALPLPYPLQPQNPHADSEIPAQPIHLHHLELRNIRAHTHLRLDLPPANPDKGQWLVILGENGTGKTTLLHAMALAMRNTDNPEIWPQGAFSLDWLSAGTAEPGKTTQGHIAFAPAHTEAQKTTITRNGSTSFKQVPEQSRASLFPVFAYGCRRGSAMGGRERLIEVVEKDGAEITTLFDDTEHLIYAEGWLKELERKSFKDKIWQPIFATVLAALQTFLAVDKLELTVDGLFVTEQQGQHLPFKSLSDGYLTSAGWFLDLLARWLHIATRTKHPITLDFMDHMCGMVLIDEIDLHLHPRWQIEIITRTRKLLPRMSFIVTTHNPLTLVGAQAEEIWILERANGKISAKPGIEMPKLLTGGQIYSQYFGISDIYPDGLGRDLNRYGFLSGFALRNDAEQAELEHLQARLQEEGILPEWDVVPRAESKPKRATTKAAKGAKP
jgi:energy-coupling factor transporter ATP-binding protein EcfA2